MLKKIAFIMVILLATMLAACQGDDQTESNGNTVQTNHNKEEAASDDQTDDSSEVPGEDTSNLDDNAASEDTVPINEESYASVKEAVDAIEDYYEVEQTNTDLGNGIEGFIEGAAGHQYISWNEGNWLVQIDFPSDPQYAVDDYEDGKSMAESIVHYLEDHMLPPPEERGIIQIIGYNDKPETLIRWQRGTSVYEIDQQTPNPMETLQVAVDYQTRNQ